MRVLLERIFNGFRVVSTFKNYQELNSGHINDTYLIHTHKKPNYVLQRINGNVFSDAGNLVVNKVLVSDFLQLKYKNFPFEEVSKKVLCFVKTKDSAFFYKDEDQNIWNLSVFIEDSITYLKTPNSKIAFEAGKATGLFLENTTDFDVALLTEILPDFHSITTRYIQFKKALKNATNATKEKTQSLISFVEQHIEEMLQIDKAIEGGIIPLRLTHSDTKISNILFTENKALCLIDTDTVMKGAIHFDYGDAIRTICNTADEDEKDLNLVDFNLDFFKSYTKGFFQELKNITKEEKEFLPVSIKMMPFIMGLRFLTDFLNMNVYYKVNYENHNLDRAKNQFAYIESINKKYTDVKLIIEREITQ
ncbi:MAG: phosphotransferase [Flavobacteriaceae bacterium]|nr:phosphotransferase [Flavobacteriaceae bacterium]